MLSGKKTWEMRSTRNRGPIGLIRKGSGQVVGIADIVDSLAGFEGKAVTASEALKRAAINLHALAIAEVVASTKRPAIWGMF